MFGSAILEVAIGIIFVYVLISLVCTAIREMIEALLKSRAAYLERGIRELLHDREAKDIAKAFFEHPMINSLYASDYKPGKNKRNPGVFDIGRNLPSYIPSKNFALALMDIASRGAPNNAATSDPRSPVLSLESIRSNVLNIQNVYVQRALLTAVDSAQGDLDRLQQNLEDWFDSSMDRISGWYRRSTQWILFWMGLIVAVGLNVDTIKIADYLFRNDDQRKLIVLEAEKVSSDPKLLGSSLREAESKLAALKLPMGWESTSDIVAKGGWLEVVKDNIVFMLLGWLLTAIAASLGAPFWFDLLNKIMVIRATVKPTEKSGPEGSEDRKSSKQAPVVIQLDNGKTSNQPHAPAALPQAVDGGAVLDAESDIDHCLVVADGTDAGDDAPTKDEDLPPSKGG